MSIGELAAIAGLKWVASPIVSSLIAKSFTSVGMDVPRELKELETDILPKLSLAIRAVSESSNMPDLKPWVQRLKSAYYEAQDLLDEAEYQRVAKMVKCKKRNLVVLITSHHVIKPLAMFSGKMGINKFSIMYPRNRKLWQHLTELKSNVKNLVKDAKIICNLLQNLPKDATIFANAAVVSVTSSRPLNKIFGRNGDRDHFVKILLEDPVEECSRRSYSVIAIVGIGGAGKTTLEQYVFHDERVVTHFDIRIWVCITRKLDVVEHTNQMIQSATNKGSPDLSSLDALQNQLIEILRESYNILLVLDDVWYDSNRGVQGEEDCKRLMAPFNSVSRCKILLTSRSKELPVALHTQKGHQFERPE